MNTEMKNWVKKGKKWKMLTGQDGSRKEQKDIWELCFC